MRARTSFPSIRTVEGRYDAFRGVDKDAREERQPLAAASAVNILARGGALRRRAALVQCFPTLPSRINGIFEVPHGAETTLLAYAGNAFYLLLDGEWQSVPVRNTTGMGLSYGLVDRRIGGFPMGERLYLVGAGIYLVYGFFDGAWEIRTADAFVPTTTVGISPLSEGDSLRRSMDAINLLTSWRQNTLFGGVGGSSWVLDGGVSNVSPMEIRATVLRDGALVERVYVNRPSEGGGTLYDPEGRAAGSIRLSTGELTLAEDTTPPTEGTNITVRFMGLYSVLDGVGGASRARIDRTRVGAVFGVGGEGDRLFLAGGSGEEATLFFSEAGDPTYFPATYTLFVGAGGRIEGLLPLPDGTMAVFSRKEGVTLLHGEYHRYYAADGSLLRTIPVFSARQSCPGAALCVPSAHGATVAAGEGHFLGGDGAVYALSHVKELSRDVYHSASRSRPIQELLRAAQGADVLYAHGGELYLFVGKELFLASVEKTYSDGNARFYDWSYHVLPSSVTSAITYQGAPLLTDDEGRCYRMEAVGHDVRTETTRAGDLGLDPMRGSIAYGAGVSAWIVSGEEIELLTEGIFAHFCDEALGIVGNRVYLGPNHALPLYEWDRVYVSGAGAGALSEGVPYYIVSPDVATRSVCLSLTRGGAPIELSGVLPTLSLYLCISHRRLRIGDINSGARRFSLFLGDGGERLHVASYFLPSGKEGSVVPTDPVARIYKKSAVVGKWRSPALSLGEWGEKYGAALSVRGAGEAILTLFDGGERRQYRMAGSFPIALDALTLSSLGFCEEEITGMEICVPIGTFSHATLEFQTADPAFCVRSVRLAAKCKRMERGVKQ